MKSNFCYIAVFSHMVSGYSWVFGIITIPLSIAPKSETGGIYLLPGTYPIRVDYFQGPKMHIALQ
ncbi:MAG: hypothetical protein V3U97_02825, partial [bacterium]